MLFRLKGLLQTGKHVVEGIGQTLHFQVASPWKGNALGQVPPLADAARRPGNVGDGRERSFCDKIPPDGCSQDKEGQYHGKNKENLVHRLVPVRASEDAAEPEALLPAGGHPEIEDIEAVCLPGNKAGDAVFQLRIYGEGGRRLAGEKRSLPAVDQHVHIIGIEGKIPGKAQASVHRGNFGNIAAHGHGQDIKGLGLGHTAADDKDEPQADCGKKGHKAGKPEGQLEFCG